MNRKLKKLEEDYIKDLYGENILNDLKETKKSKDNKLKNYLSNPPKHCMDRLNLNKK